MMSKTKTNTKNKTELLQNNYGNTALMIASERGKLYCVIAKCSFEETTDMLTP